jgi:tetratricopeptide (TPR) repeat protein
MKKMKNKIIILCLALFITYQSANQIQASPIWNLESGINLINMQKYDEAAKFFEGYTKSNPNDSDGHYYLGVCYKNLNKMQKSAEHLQKSYELSKNIEKINVAPSYTYDDSTEDDYLDMANMYFDAGNYNKALQYAGFMLNVNPNSTNGLLLKTKIYYKQNNLKLAKAYFNKALMLDNSLLKSIWAKNLNITTLPKYDFDYYNTKGLEYYYSADCNNAVTYFNKALELEPKSTAVYNNLALCYMKQNKVEEARKALMKAKKIDPNFNLTYINLAKLEALKGALYQKNTNKQREKYLKQALSVNPNSKYAYLELGNYYLENKKFDLANKNFKNAVLIDGNFYEALMGLGISYVEEGNLSDAIKVLRRASIAIKNGGKNPDMLYYLAKICIANANFLEAKGYLLDAIKQTENPNYYFELGKIYYQEEDLASAENAFRKALELDLEFTLEADIYNYFGLIEYKNFDTEKAVAMFKRAVSLDPNRAMYLYNLAQAYKSVGNNNAYSKEINAIASLKPKTVQDYLDFSTIYYDKKNTATAIKILTEGIMKYPDERSLYETKLKLYKATKDPRGIKETENEIKARFKKPAGN